MTATVEEDEAKIIAAIDVGCMKMMQTIHTQTKTVMTVTAMATTTGCDAYEWHGGS
jgi:hypothetical protein